MERTTPLSGTCEMCPANDVDLIDLNVTRTTDPPHSLVIGQVLGKKGTIAFRGAHENRCTDRPTVLLLSAVATKTTVSRAQRYSNY